MLSNATIGVIILAAVWLVWYLSPTATPPSVSAPGLIQPSTPVVGDSVINFVPPVDNTNINNGSAAPSVDIAVTSVVPTIVPTVSPTPIVLANGQKSVRLYSNLNFKGTELVLPAGEISSAPLGMYQNGTYVPQWKSMRVDPGVKIMFTLHDVSPGVRLNLRKSFAIGRSDVPDIDKWLRSQPSIAGLNNWGYGSLDLNRILGQGYGRLSMTVLSDDAWNAAIKTEYTNCMAYVAQMKKTAPSQYSDADCASITAATFSQVYT